MGAAQDPRHIPQDPHPSLTLLQAGAGGSEELPVAPLLLQSLQPQHAAQKGALGGVLGAEPGRWESRVRVQPRRCR